MKKLVIIALLAFAPFAGSAQPPNNNNNNNNNNSNNPGGGDDACPPDAGAPLDDYAPVLIVGAILFYVYTAPRKRVG
jgi:hypothetical protein